MAQKNNDVRNGQVTNLSGYFDRLELIDSAGPTTLVTFSITWGTASSGSISVSGTPISATASNTGDADEARLFNSGGSEQISAITVATSGADINMNTTQIESGKGVDLDSFTLTEPSSTQ